VIASCCGSESVYWSAPWVPPFAVRCHSNLREASMTLTVRAVAPVAPVRTATARASARHGSAARPVRRPPRTGSDFGSTFRRLSPSPVGHP
jgi:hypothetical protein